MKKRLLITSIVMMLVCAVALSTATYAWFTSNKSVQATRITMRASTSDAASLTIGWTGEQEGTFLEIPEGTDWILKPLAPNVLDGNKKVALEDGVTTYENGDAKQLFYSETVKTENNGLVQFNGNGGTDIKPVLYKKGDNYKFYVKNNSAANEIDYVRVTGVYTYESDNYVFMSVDTRNEPPVDDHKYYENSPTGTEKTGEQIKAENNDSWNPGKVYYEKVLRYEPTGDDTPQEDTTYYIITSGTIEAGNAEFAAVAHNTFDYVTPFSSDSAAENYKGKFYEKRDLLGDDMLRIAIFTREFRKVDKTQTPTPVAGVKYYTYNGNNILKNGDNQALIGTESNSPAANEINAFEAGVEYFYVPDRFVLTNDVEALTGKKYYTSAGVETEFAAGTVYEKVPETSHVLLGILGKDATAFNLVNAANDFDINEVYFSASFTAASTINSAETFETAKQAGDLYYTTTSAPTTYIAVQINDVYDSNLNYFVRNNFERVHDYTKVDVDSDNFATIKSNNSGKLYIYENSSYTIVGDGDSYVSNADYYVKGFVSGKYYYTAANTVVNGKIDFDKAVNAMNYYTDVAEELNVAYNLRPHEQVEIVAVAWFDGTALDDTRSNQYAQFSLFFDTDRTSHTSYNQQ